MDQLIKGQKAIVRRFYEEFWNKRNFEAIHDLMKEDVIFRGSLGADMNGHTGVKRYAEIVFHAFPDFTITLEEMISENSKLAACLSYSGTHEGELFGIPSTGKQINYVGTGIFIFADGLISHCWVLGDRLEMLRQMSRNENSN